MSNDDIFGASGSGTEPGSPSTENGDPSVNGESPGEDGGDVTKEDDATLKTQYEELSKAFGKQGQELGELRSFYEDLTPLLTKLYDQPEVMDAILDGKLDSELAKAVLAGNVSIKDATDVSDAHAQVKKDMGKEYDKASKEDIEKLVLQKVEERLAEHRVGLERDISKIESRREFENSVQDFIANTPDFSVYLDAINDWLKENPKQSDIKVAYEAVKGRETMARAKQESEARAAEEAKRVAANAAGGSGSSSGTISNPDLIDQFIAPIGDPNSLL